MKLIINLLSIILVSGVLVMQSGCKKPAPAPEPVSDQQLALLTKGPWKISAVTRSGTDELSNYTGFGLTMTGTKGQQSFGFSTTSRPTTSPWPSSGTFTFDAVNPATTLSRNDTPPITVTYSVTSSDLTMSFQYDGAGFQGRSAVVNGLWVFTFTH